MALVAWGAPFSARRWREARPAPLPVVRQVQAGGPLLWSPGGGQTPSGKPEARPTGWTGLLLGYPLDLNAATAEDLEALPGVGPGTASALVAARRELGGFRQTSDLLLVPRIGEKTLARLRPWVAVTPSGGTRTP